MKSVLFFVCGLFLCLLSGISIAVFPNFLRGFIERDWLYSVDMAPLDLRLFGVCAVSLAVCLPLSLFLLRRWFFVLPRKYLAAGLCCLVLILLPFKNGSAAHSLFFSFGGLGSILLFRATFHGGDGALSLVSRAWGTICGVPALRWQLMVFSAGMALYLFSAGLVFDLIPHVVDETVYLFQARLFARGIMWTDYPASPDFFHVVNLMEKGGKWLSQYPPGWPALLAVGVFIGAPWLVNPALGSISVLVIFHLARDLYGEKVARLASLLALFSPYFLTMNGSMMSHTPAGLFALLFLLFFERGLRNSRHSLMFFSTLSLGVCATIRPYTAFLIGIPSALFFGRDLILDFRGKFLMALSAFAGVVAPVCALLAYNHATTGSALVFGYEHLYGDTIALGFGPRQFPYPHTLMEGLKVFHSRLLAISRNLFLSAAPALFIGGTALVLKKGCGYTWWLALTFLSLPIGYVFYYFQDLNYEPRFLFESAGALVALSSLGIYGIFQKLKDRKAAAHYLLIVLLLTAFIFTPAYLKTFRRIGDVGPELKNMLRERDIHRGLVLVQPLYYPMGMMLQSPLLDDDNIFVQDLAGRRLEITSKFPDRKVYRFYRDRDDGSFKLVLLKE